MFVSKLLRFRYLRFLSFCAMALLSVNVFGAGKVLEVSSIAGGSVSLSEYFAVLDDPASELTLVDVRKSNIAERFMQAQTGPQALSFGFTDSTLWLRLHIRNSSNQSAARFLELGFPRISEIQFYYPNSNVGYHMVATGAAKPFASRAYKNRHFVFPVSVPANTDQIYYIKLRSDSALLVPAILWEPEAFHAFERTDYLLQALYFGMAFALIGFNLLLFFMLREGLYLQYASFAILAVLTVSIPVGLAHEFLWPEASWWSNRAFGVLFPLAAVALIEFSRQILDTRKLVPHLDQILKALEIVAVLFSIGCVVALSTVFPFLVMFSGAYVVMIFLVAVICALKRQRSAYLFLIAFTVFFIGLVANALRGMGILPHGIFTAYGAQVGSALEMLLFSLALSDRYKTFRKEKEWAQSEAIQAQATALNAQQNLVEVLQNSEQILEERVAQRTEELHLTVQTLGSTLNELRSAQTQLIQSEKMASLGQLVANIAHEINTPIAAVKSSGQSITDAVHQIRQTQQQFWELDQPTQTLFSHLVSHAGTRGKLLSNRDERNIVRDLARQLEQAGIALAGHRASVMVELNAEAEFSKYLPLMRHPESELILGRAYNMALIFRCTININAAVERVSKIIFSLKSFSGDSNGNAREMTVASLESGIEAVLTLYGNQIGQGTTLIRQYEDLPPLYCRHNELSQVWTHLIQNALQAMQHDGVLTIGVRRVNDTAVVSVGDTGCGIPEEIRGRIFDPFFTTRAIGEGSGLGLDIARKIVEAHEGRIEVDTEVGAGTTFSVFLPLNNLA